MDFVKEDELFDWRTADPAGIYIRYTRKAPDPPQEFACTVINHSAIEQPGTIRVLAANLQFLGAGLFGSPHHPNGNQPGRTDRHCKFGVYAHVPGQGQHNVVILRADGSGLHVYVDPGLAAAEMWKYLCETCSSAMLWNICSCIVHTYDLARQKGREEIMTAFVERRLKKSRRPGSTEVFIKPKIIDVTQQRVS